MNDNTTQMQKVVLQPASAKYLTVNDNNAATAIAKNNKYGQEKGWWK